MNKKNLTDKQIHMVTHYENYLYDIMPECDCDCSYWDIHESAFFIGGETLSAGDSFDLGEYFKLIGIPETEYEFNT